MAKTKGVLITLYLTDWQIRMIRDIYGAECHVWNVEFGGSVKRYMVYPPVDPKSTRMYLTGSQMQEIKDAAGTTCHFIELKKSDLVKYRVPALKDPTLSI
jgi:hypothetical protein